MVIAKGSRVEKKSTVQFVSDGMIVRFAYHQPRKYFFEPRLLKDFVDKYQSDVDKFGVPQESTFEMRQFRLVFWKTADVIRLKLAVPISGHGELILSKRKLISDIQRLFV